MGTCFEKTVPSLLNRYFSRAPYPFRVILKPGSVRKRATVPFSNMIYTASYLNAATIIATLTGGELSRELFKHTRINTMRGCQPCACARITEAVFHARRFRSTFEFFAQRSRWIVSPTSARLFDSVIFDLSMKRFQEFFHFFFYLDIRFLFALTWVKNLKVKAVISSRAMKMEMNYYLIR